MRFAVADLRALDSGEGWRSDQDQDRQEDVMEGEHVTLYKIPKKESPEKLEFSGLIFAELTAAIVATAGIDIPSIAMFALLVSTDFVPHH